MRDANIKPIYKGDLSKINIYELMIRLGVLKENGYIEIVANGSIIKVFLYMGDIVNIESENAEFSLAGFMRKKGRITDEQLNDVKKLVQSGEKSTADILMTLGFIKSHEIIQLINEFLICVLGQIASILKGMYIFYRIEGTYPFSVNLRFNTVDAVKTVIFSYLPDEYFLRLFSRHNDINIIVKSSGLTVESARLGPKELRYLKAIYSSDKFVDFLPIIDPKNSEHIYKLKAAYYFKLCSFIDMKRGNETFESVFYVEKTQSDMASKCNASLSNVVSKSGDAAIEVKTEEDTRVRELEILFEELKKKNFFERLGISEDASDAQVKKAYLALAKKYHPDIVTVDASKKIKKCYEDIFALINEAYQRLEKSESRKDYLESIKQSKDGKSEVDISSILEEEAKFIRAKALIKNNRNVETGLQILEEIIKKNPDEEYKVYYLWGKFLKEKPTDLSEINKIISSLEQIARKREMPDLFLFLGYLYKAIKNEEKMIDSFKKLLKLDPNNTIASIEIKLYEKRKK
ncbi:MAG: DnaJ domain-containing protein [Deltaproteobacteria bacterium]|nr:DnaJ domain-containing protein [Deltaproteobacteria bacterium]